MKYETQCLYYYFCIFYFHLCNVKRLVLSLYWLKLNRINVCKNKTFLLRLVIQLKVRRKLRSFLDLNSDDRSTSQRNLVDQKLPQFITLHYHYPKHDESLQKQNWIFSAKLLSNLLLAI